MKPGMAMMPAMRAKVRNGLRQRLALAHGARVVPEDCRADRFAVPIDKHGAVHLARQADRADAAEGVRPRCCEAAQPPPGRPPTNRADPAPTIRDAGGKRQAERRPPQGFPAMRRPEPPSGRRCRGRFRGHSCGAPYRCGAVLAGGVRRFEPSPAADKQKDGQVSALFDSDSRAFRRFSRSRQIRQRKNSSRQGRESEERQRADKKILCHRRTPSRPVTGRENGGPDIGCTGRRGALFCRRNSPDCRRFKRSAYSGRWQTASMLWPSGSRTNAP